MPGVSEVVPIGRVSGVGLSLLFEISIDVAAGSDANDEHEQFVIFDLVDDAVVADADTVE
jgi:hypothetical protein